MHKMTEEKVTIAILTWLQNAGWQVVCFDFPQSGTGIALHPNPSLRGNSKNKGAIIPDIVACKNGTALFFENKNRFVLADFQKIHHLKTTQDYSEAISELLKTHPTERIFYGIGLPHSKNVTSKIQEYGHLVDFVVAVHPNANLEIVPSGLW